MNTPLRILNLEDSRDDSELIQWRLQKANLACEIIRVTTKDEFGAALAARPADLILADYTLPGFDGMSALAMVREQDAELPFIFVSGTMGEDIAIEALKSGATDYVLKNNLERLAPAVRRAMNEKQEKTERRRAEEEARTSAVMWNNTFDAINDAISVMDMDGRILRSNRAMLLLMSAMGPETTENRPCWEVVHHAASRIDGCPFAAMQQSRRRESRTVLQTGRWYQITADPLFDPEGKLSGCVHIMADITEQKLAQEQLRDSESKFHRLAEQTLVGAYIAQDDVFRYVNPRFAEMFAYSVDEITDHMGVLDLVLADDRRIAVEQMSICLLGEKVHSHYEVRGMKKNGDIITLEVFNASMSYGGKPAALGVVLDTTEKKILERQLLQAQKMEAVGQLTSGIAHDFNNILSAIISYASLAQKKTEEGSELRSFVDQILSGSDRAADLTRSLLTFSRKRTAAFQPIDINETIKIVENLLRKIIGEDIELRVATEPEELVVNADSGQLEQVLMNLATNARDAMPGGGVLTISTGVRQKPEFEAGADAGRGYAVIAVTDTGTGMDEKTKAKIFEPFFTTKEPGRGTGLGLSMVYGIVNQHNGRILCSSRPGEGTTFRIYLPLLSQQASAAGTGAQPSAAESLRGSEMILVAEDDDVIRSIQKTALENFGYSVVTAVNGREAVDVFLAHRDAISLVLCDVIMPRMNGYEVKNAIRKEKPAVPVLFTSGYPAEIVRQMNLLDSDEEIIPKPFTPTLLLRKVRDTLNHVH